MSDTLVKGVKRTASTPASRRIANTAAKSRALANKSARLKPIAKRAKAEKAPAKKATKAKTVTNAKTKAKAIVKSSPKVSTKKLSKSKVEKVKAIKKKVTVSAKSPKAKTKLVQAKAKTLKPATKKVSTKTSKKPVAAVAKAKSDIARKSVSKAQPVKTKPQSVAVTPKTKPKKTALKPALPPPAYKSVPANHNVPKQPSPNVSAALHLFEKAHKDFARGRFAEARSLFQQLLEKHSSVVEVAARARTYLAITETRLKSETSLPKDADSLYDRGVVELNRGAYETAQHFFEMALKQDSNAAHIHYGLAATQSQLGQFESALKSLETAFSLQGVLRFRAAQDQDFTALHNIPEFESLVFSD